MNQRRAVECRSGAHPTLASLMLLIALQNSTWMRRYSNSFRSCAAAAGKRTRRRCSVKVVDCSWQPIDLLHTVIAHPCELDLQLLSFVHQKLRAGTDLLWCLLPGDGRQLDAAATKATMRVVQKQEPQQSKPWISPMSSAWRGKKCTPERGGQPKRQRR